MASPVSDDSSSTERNALRGLAEQPRIQERIAAMSPRSALLSQSSLRTDGHSNSAFDLGQVRKYNTGSRRKRGLDVTTRPSALTQLLDMDISRKDPKGEVMRLREILKTIEHQSNAEAKRAKELERVNREVQQRVEQLAADRLAAEQQAIKAQQEVRLVQLQLENAQKEVERGQDAMKEIEQQRDEAEAAAARARAKARKLHQEKVAALAREEGRRIGFQAGFDYARAERQMVVAKKKSPHGSRSHTQPETRVSSRGDKGKQKAFMEAKKHDEVPNDVAIPHRTRTSQSILPPARVQTVDDIIASPTSEEMSPFQLPLKGLPPMDYRSEHFTMPPAAESTPLRPFVPPPESEVENEFAQAISQPVPMHHPPPNDHYSRSKTPSVQVYQIDIPSASEINRQYNNSMENETIPPQPRENWVTASSYHEIRGPRPPQFPGKLPPPLLPPPRQRSVPNAPPQPAPPAPKTVRFPKISRPSLAKTKEQASSWYRSFSFRRKNKRVIDPIPEEVTSAGPVTGSTINDDSEPPSATEPPYTGESQESYGEPGRPSESWYQGKPASMRPGPSVPPSVRSGYSRPRPASDAMSVSTRVSQFDLLATPAAPPAISVRSGKEGAKRVKEKDSYLSVIREDPASRGNTPDRYASRPSTDNMRPTSSNPQPNFAQQPVHQQPSTGTFQSSNRRLARHAPPGIAVPDHDQELEPFGVAYNRAIGSKPNYTYHETDLTRRPSKISERATPDTSHSIAIDVVPPSGVAPPVVHSPPHTGQNHLSPYHTYQPPAPIFSQSITSLRSQAGNARASSSAAVDLPPSTVASRKQSRQSLGKGYADSVQGYISPSNERPPSNTHARPPSGTKNNSYDYANSSQNYDDARSVGRTSHLQSQYQQPPQARPESVTSGTSKRPNLQPFIAQQYPSTSQVSLSLTADGGVRGQPANASAKRLVLATPIQRKGSNASLRSQGSYSKYDPTGYIDPAFWSPSGPPPPPATEHPHVEGYFDPGAPFRPTSANSGLSYISQPHR